MKRVVAIVVSLIVVISSSAQDIEQLTKADPVAWSGGVTWSNIFTWPKDSASQVPTLKGKEAHYKCLYSMEAVQKALGSLLHI